MFKYKIKYIYCVLCANEIILSPHFLFTCDQLFLVFGKSSNAHVYKKKKKKNILKKIRYTQLLNIILLTTSHVLY